MPIPRILSSQFGDYKIAPCVSTIAFPRLLTIKYQNSLENARRLFAFLLKKNTGPRVIGRTFAIDRRDLEGFDDLDLTDSKIRTATGWLLKLGLVEVVPRKDKAVWFIGKDGLPWKIATAYQFSSEILTAILKMYARLKKSPIGRVLDINTLKKDKIQIEETLMGEIARKKHSFDANGDYVPAGRVVIPSAKHPDLFDPTPSSTINYAKMLSTKLKEAAEKAAQRVSAPFSARKPSRVVVQAPRAPLTLPTDTTPAHLRMMGTPSFMKAELIAKRKMSEMTGVTSNDAPLQAAFERIARMCAERRGWSEKATAG